MYGYPEFPTTNFHDFDLHQLIKMYKKLVDEYNGLVNDIATLKMDFGNYQNYVNNSIGPLVQNANMQYLTKLTMLENQVKAANTQFNSALAAEMANRKTADLNIWNYITSLENQLKQWQTEYQATLKQIQQITDGKIEAVKLYLMGRDAYYNEQMLDITQDLQNQINELPESVTGDLIRNPVTGLFSSVKEALNDIWYYAIPVFGFTVEEWEQATYITCGYFDKTDITALSFYTDGKIILSYYYPLNHVFSPTTGEYVTVQTALYQLAEMVKRGITVDMGGLTAREYDNKNLTAEAYDTVSVDGYNYDWNGKETLNDVQ